MSVRRKIPGSFFIDWSDIPGTIQQNGQASASKCTTASREQSSIRGLHPGCFIQKKGKPTEIAIFALRAATRFPGIRSFKTTHCYETHLRPVHRLICAAGHIEAAERVVCVNPPKGGAPQGAVLASTLQKGINLAGKYRQKGDQVTLLIGEGTYRLTKTLEMTAAQLGVRETSWSCGRWTEHR